MTDEELCKRMRDFGHVDAHIAAERIEALVKERDELLGAQILNRTAIRLQKQKREAAEAALKEAFREGFIVGAESGWASSPNVDAHWERSNACAKHGSQT